MFVHVCVLGAASTLSQSILGVILRAIYKPFEFCYRGSIQRMYVYECMYVCT